MHKSFLSRCSYGAVLLATFGCCGSLLAAQGDGLSITHLRCEALDNPVGIDAAQPRLGWIVESAVRGQRQSAYRFLVATDRQLLSADHGDLWDSGKIESNQTTGIAYAGAPLQSRTHAFWKVKTWDKDGVESAWSEPASFVMGLLEPQDWTAQWISHADPTPLHTDRNTLFLPPATQYRKQFSAAKTVKRAMVYASALGIYELQINGERVTDARFTPGWSDYKQRVYYNTYEVTSLLNTGENAIGLTVADGWYSGYVGYALLVGYGPNKAGRYLYGKTPSCIAQLELEYTDGSRETIGTDRSWETSTGGPFREADIIMGETFDARLSHPGWSKAGSNTSGWKKAISAEADGSTKAIFSDVTGNREVELGFQKPDVMQAYPAPPVRPTQEIKPLTVTEQKPGVFIFDMGQNFAGVVRLKVKGPAGTAVQLRYGEMLYPDGRLMTENLRRARAIDHYILRGDDAGETWTPRFTYHGFRYVELTGYPGKPDLDAVTGVVIQSDTPRVSKFECSDPMANQLFKNINWTQRANFVDIPTDCPQRDERLGWMGDAQIYVRTACDNADVEAFFTKWMCDVQEAQRSSGAYPDYCPYPMAHGQPGKTFGTAWTDAGVIVPWTIWKVYGDTRIIQSHYDSLTRFMQFREKSSPNNEGVSIGNPWGDWLNMNETTPIEYIDAAYYANSAKMMADMAAAIGRTDDAMHYRQLLSAIDAAFDARYLNPDGSLKVETETAYVLALSFHLLPANLEQAAADHLAGMIEKSGFHMATGFLGTKSLLPVLSAHGHHDLAVRLFQSRQFPSWGYEVANGATTVWERWDSYTTDHGFDGISGKNNAAMNSFSHYSFGAVCEWMFRSLVGLDTDGPGFEKLIIRPGPPDPGSNPDVAPITWVKAEYDSPHGKIVSNWKRDGDHFTLDLTIPANVTATVEVPTTDAPSVTEGNHPVKEVNGIQVMGSDEGRLMLSVPSGSYQFASTVRR
jgi:alpha-L-rhamnosidase